MRLRRHLGSDGAREAGSLNLHAKSPGKRTASPDGILDCVNDPAVRMLPVAPSSLALEATLKVKTSPLLHAAREPGKAAT